MARLEHRRSENVDGELYVDTTCIDCDTCRWVAPGSFNRAGDMSRVFRQPTDDASWQRALMALVACPTASIGTTGRHDLKPALSAFPEEITDDVFYCGFADEQSFGATSYLVRREANGAPANILVDAPRFAGPLVKRIEGLAGVAHLFLTHKDDVGDHEKWAAHFGCERILHAADVNPGTRDVERQLEGDEPVPLDDGDDDVLLIPVSGHTEGSVCLLWRDKLFAGDHVYWSPVRERLLSTVAYCQYDWDVQRASVMRLLDHDFRWLLPGHGRRAVFEPDEMKAQLRRCVAWMADPH